MKNKMFYNGAVQITSGNLFFASETIDCHLFIDKKQRIEQQFITLKEFRALSKIVSEHFVDFILPLCLDRGGWAEKQ